MGKKEENKNKQNQRYDKNDIKCNGRDLTMPKQH